MYLVSDTVKKLFIFLKSIAFLDSLWYTNIVIELAGRMELADVLDSKSSGSDSVRVRPPLPAP